MIYIVCRIQFCV